MLALSNSQLQIDILDPRTDAKHFGTRYCTGGYIWQIRHEKYGDLLSGPQFPKQNPDTFDGQGAPEVFESAPDADIEPVGGSVLVPGVGIVKKTSPIIPFHVRDNLEIQHYCVWDVKQTENTVEMFTIQNFRSFRCEIKRNVELDNLRVKSITEFSYYGEKPFTMRWFAHPFFPLNEDNRCCRFSIPVSISESHAFYINPENELIIKKTIDRKRSAFTPLMMQQESSISIEQFHPRIKSIMVTPDFPVAKMPVWTNDVTFSFEPYMITTLQPGESVSWGISYQI